MEQENIKTRKVVKKIFLLVWLLYFAYCIYYLIDRFEEYHWDFKMQSGAARILAQGKNPYDPRVTRVELGTPLWYAYPPATLWFYRLFNFMGEKTACLVFLFLKVGAIFFLLWFWSKYFLEEKLEAAFCFFCLFAYNSALFLDLRSGNINLFEQLLLWLSFYFFLKNRLPLCCGLVLLAASFKIMPIFFLVLILFKKNRHKVWLFLSSAALFLGYFLIQYALWPQMFRAFLEAGRGTLVERRIISPTTFGFITEIFDLLARRRAFVINQEWQEAIFGLIILFVLFFSYRAYLVLKKYEPEDKEKIVVFLLCLIYALITLRMKDYAYVLLLVPSYYIIKKPHFFRAFPFLFALSILTAAKNVTLPDMGSIYLVMWEYYPLLLAYLIWILYLQAIFSLKKQS
jgi:hypothetical protein